MNDLAKEKKMSDAESEYSMIQLVAVLLLFCFFFREDEDHRH
jgi:hypothetical protein